MTTTQQPSCACITPRAERIALLNDKLRINGVGGRIVMTQGIHTLIGSDVSGLLKALAAFADFDPDSDPHGERDFGLFDFADQELLWKIDYYSDHTLSLGSDDPADPTVTERVLTIMLAEEY